MKKYILFSLIVFLLVGCSFPGKNNDSNLGGGKQNNKKGGITGTFKDIIAKNTPMKCESAVEGEDGEGKMAGIVQGNQYVGQMTVNGKMANILMKDNCMWTWQEGEKNGIKTCFEVEGDGGLMGNVDARQLNENVNCSPTMISPNTFSPPPNVSFLDMDEIGNGNLTPEQMKQLEDMSEE